MKRQLLGVLIFLLCAGLANAQLYRNRFEAGDTLVGNTPDTTSRCMIYNGNADNPRPIRPTVYMLVTKIGTNTTHSFLQVDVDIADRELAKDGNGWARVHTERITDYEGFGAGPYKQCDLAIPMPWLEQYAGQYFRLILTYIKGSSADSTAYELVYLADESGNMYTPPLNYYKNLTHDILFQSASSKAINGADSTNTDHTDLRIEVSPGVYRLPDRGFATIFGDTKCDDDSVIIVVKPTYFGGEGADIDTLILPISNGKVAVGEFSMTLQQGTGFPSEAIFYVKNESASADDTTNFWMEIHLECDP